MSGPPCAVCGAPLGATADFARLRVPRLLNVVLRDATAARAVPTGALDYRGCGRCGFVGNVAFDGVEYDPRYLVDPSGSPRFRRHLDEVLDAILRRSPARPLHLLELGCGRAGLLRALSDRLGPGLGSAVGFDPAADVTAALPPRVQVHPRRFTAAACAALPARPHVVVLRHLVEHLPRPVDLLREVVDAFAGGPPVQLFVETPDVDASLARGRLHDFYYEHCALFGVSALAHALGCAGATEVEVGGAYDGEYLVAQATIPTTRSAGPPPPPPVADPPGPRLAALAQDAPPRMRRLVAEHAARGPVVLWGAAGKGITLAALLDPDGTSLAALVDQLPEKHGSFAPATAHPILAPSALVGLQPEAVLVANATYLDEVRRAVAALVPGAVVVSLDV